MKKRLLLYCILVQFACIALAQPGNFHFINFSAKDGLPDKFVYCAEQDNRGYMWFGTGSGLYRYDGHRFVHFNSPADVPGHSISNILQAITKDDAGHLWLGGLNAVQLFDPVSGKFRAPDFSKGDNAKVQNASILNFSKGSNGTIWLATQYSYFFRFNKSDSSFTHFNRYPATASKSVLRVVETGSMVYAVHTEGIYRFASDGTNSAFFSLKDDKITNAAEDKKNNRILCGTYKSGVVVFDCQSATFTTDARYNGDMKNSLLFNLTVSNDGRMMYTGSYNFDIIDLVSGKHQVYRQSKDEFELGVTKIAGLFIDRENNVWLCSHFGLSMMPWQNHQVETSILVDKVSGNGVEPVNAYTATGKEVLITNTSTAGLMLYNNDDKTVSTVINTIKHRKNISSLIAAPGNKWYASDGTTLYEYLPAIRQLRPTALADQWGRPIVKAGRSVVDKQGKVYIESVSNGFYTWQYPSGTIVHYNKWDVDITDSSKAKNSMAPCFTDSKNNVWFTSDNGVYRYDVGAAAWHHIAYKEQNSIPAMRESSDITEDRQGHIWITSVVNGLYEWYTQNGKEILKNYNRDSGIGLPADFCWRVQQSPVDSFLWISSINGLLKFDPVAKQVTSVFTRQNGLHEDNGGYTFSILPGNKLVQLFYANINIIDLDHYQENKFRPQVQFNSVKVLDKEYVFQIQDSTPLLELAAGENFLQFEFAALVFNNANRNRYAWQLSGFDTNWIQGGFANHVSYAALQPGKYLFRVKAANSDGYWGSERSIIIIIRSPFYARWWFILFCIIGFSALLYFIYQSKVRQARREEKLKAGFQQQLAETEMKALRAQMNPHFIFNSLNSIQKYILKNDQFNASQYLTKFSRLIRLILDHSNQSSILLSSELDLLKLYIEMESMRFDNRFHYEIKVAEHINAENIFIPSMLIQPYIENAIWHGLLHKTEKGTLLVTFSLKSDMLTVTIDDNGIGREKARELKSKQLLTKKSYGMQITQDRITVINKMEGINTTCTIIDKKDSVGNATGTCVELNIPVKKIKN